MKQNMLGNKNVKICADAFSATEVIMKDRKKAFFELKQIIEHCRQGWT